MADKLTIKQEKFAQGLFAGLSQREAYKQAYETKSMSDKTVDEEASKLASNPKITTRLEQLTNELKERNMVTVEKVLNELSHIAFDDIKNYLRFYTDPSTKEIKMEVKDSDTIDTRSVSEVQLGKDGQFKFKLYCKDEALTQIGRHLGMFKDNLNVNANMNVQIVDDIDD
jgi:phage terminase small subunit